MKEEKKNLLLYNNEYQKILDINNEYWVSYALEKENDDNTKLNNEYLQILTCTKKGINLIVIDIGELEVDILKDNQS